MSVSQETGSLKKTPLYPRHLSLQGKIVNFSGWAMPVYYSGIIAEHLWVREKCGIFDVSHLGEVRVKGSEAFTFLQRRLTNDLSRLQDGGILYNLLCDDTGLAIDDILVYRENRNDYYLIVNAANIETDLQALLAYAGDGVEITDKSDSTACVAVQGPLSESVIERLFPITLKDLGYYRFKAGVFGDGPVWISRSGYTGEDGFEIFAPNEAILAVWDRLMEAGEAQGIKPAGLGARNTLRLEAGNALFGNDIDRTCTPLEAGLSWAVSFDKGDFVGREALLEQKRLGLQKRLVAFKMLERSVAREHYAVLAQGKPIGAVTSGSFGPSVGANIGLAYVAAGHEKVGTRIEIEIHGRPVPAEVVKRPFVALKHKK